MTCEKIDRDVLDNVGIVETPPLPAVLLFLPDPDQCRRMAMLLNRQGLRCLIAEDREAALECVASAPEIGVVIAGQMRGELPLIVGDLRQRCLRPLAAILLLPDSSYRLLRQIALSGPADILPETPDDEELLRAVRAALGWYRQSLGMGDLTHNILRMLTQIEAQLGRLMSEPQTRAALPPPTRAAVAPPALIGSRIQAGGAGVDRETVKAIMRVHSAQAKLLGYGLVDDAAWIMLLDLLLMHLEGKTLAVTSLCVGSGVPVTTALRRLDQLISKGLALKSPDRADRRRLLVSITPKGIDCVSAIVEQMQGELLRPVVAA
jgi:predicted transcriptional regulator